MLNKTQEEALKIILGMYDGNKSYEVSGDYSEFPEYINASFGKTFELFESLGLIARTVRTMTTWSVILTPDGISYFSNKMRLEEKGNQVFTKLPSNSKRLLDKILQSENPVMMLCERFDNCSHKEDDELRSLLMELEHDGYILIPYWADDMPGDLTINNSARSYDERLKEYERQFQQPVVNQVICYGNIYGVATTGDITNSTINIENSIDMIHQDIESKGGEDKEDLHSLLKEVEILVEEIKRTKQISDNPTLFQKISSHMSKHGWFYGAVIGLIGQVAFQVISGT